MFDDRLTDCMTVFYCIQAFLSDYHNEIENGIINDGKTVVFET